MMTAVKAHGYIVVCDRFSVVAPAERCGADEHGVLLRARRRLYPFATRQAARRAIRRTYAFARRKKWADWLHDHYSIVCVTKQVYHG